ncbi:MAG: LamG domain-containing protein, partial [bacterium]|nr:LamG domain-containing protein [bacterium]
TIQYDSGPYANNATGSSASLVTSTAGPYGSGALLNGSTDYFTLDNTTVLPAGAAVRTFEIEFETDDITLGSYTLFSYGTHISANRFAIQQIDNSIRVFTLDSAAETTATITTGKRYTLGVTYNGTQINAWLNGVKIMSDISLVMGTSSGTTAYIGSLDGTQDFFKGKIGFVRAYDRVLADDEMTAPYLRARGDTVIRSNEAKMISTSDVVSHISGYDPAYVVDVFSLSDLPTASAGVITLEAKMYVFHSIVVFSDGLVIPDDSTTILKMPEYGFNTYLLYTGTGTFITGASNAGLRIIDASIGMTGAGAKCFDVNGTVGLDFLSIICLGTNQT